MNLSRHGVKTDSSNLCLSCWCLLHCRQHMHWSCIPPSAGTHCEPKVCLLCKKSYHISNWWQVSRTACHPTLPTKHHFLSFWLSNKLFCLCDSSTIHSKQCSEFTKQRLSILLETQQLMPSFNPEPFCRPVFFFFFFKYRKLFTRSRQLSAWAAANKFVHIAYQRRKQWQQEAACLTTPGEAMYSQRVSFSVALWIFFFLGLSTGI